VEFKVQYRTPRSDGNQNTSFSALGRSVHLSASASGDEGILKSVWTLPEPASLRFSGIALAATQDFQLAELRVGKKSPPLLPYEMNNLPPSTSIHSFPAHGLPAAALLPVAQKGMKLQQTLGSFAPSAPSSSASQ